MHGGILKVNLLLGRIIRICAIDHSADAASFLPIVDWIKHVHDNRVVYRWQNKVSGHTELKVLVFQGLAYLPVVFEGMSPHVDGLGELEAGYGLLIQILRGVVDALTGFVAADPVANVRDEIVHDSRRLVDDNFALACKGGHFGSISELRESW